MKLQKLTDREVEILHSTFPGIEDPYYPSRIMRLNGPNFIKYMEVGFKHYLVFFNNAKEGKDDEWYLINY